MPVYEFEIGSSYGAMVNVESLTTPLVAPRSTFAAYSQDVELASGGARGAGWPLATWAWNFMSQAQRDQLKTFCVGKSAEVYIKTLQDDGAYQVYTGVMVWPSSEQVQAGRVLDLTVEFRGLVEYTP